MPPQKGFGKPKNAKKTIGRILQYMGKFKALWLVVFLCVITSSGASVIGTYLIKPALNNYIIPLIGKQNPDFTDFAKKNGERFNTYKVKPLKLEAKANGAAYSVNIDDIPLNLATVPSSENISPNRAPSKFSLF